MWTEKLQIYKLSLEKTEEPEMKLPTIVNHGESKGIPEKKKKKKKTTSVLLTKLMSLSVLITANYGKFLSWKYQTTLPVSWATYMKLLLAVKKQQLEPDM